jgi:hypothetical protein
VKVLSNTVGSFLTGSAIADAVMALNLALTRRHQVDIVDIPFIDSDGNQCRVQLTVGWHVELVTQTNASTMVELLEPDTIRDFTDRTAGMSEPVALTFTLEELRDIAWEEDGALLG